MILLNPLRGLRRAAFYNCHFYWYFQYASDAVCWFQKSGREFGSGSTDGAMARIGERQLHMMRRGLSIGAALLSCAGFVSSGATPLQISTTSLPDGLVGTPYSQTLSATGGATPYQWQVTSGRLPSGLTLDSVTGLISGIPNQATYGGFITFTVTDAGSPPQTATTTLTLTIPAILTITTRSLPDGQVGVPYSQTLTATDGIPPYNWALTKFFLCGDITEAPAAPAVVRRRMAVPFNNGGGPP